MRSLLQAMTSVPVDDQVAERAGRPGAGTPLGLPDALIAATALEHRLTLMTRNARDFSGIKGLRLRIPDHGSTQQDDSR